MDPALCPAAALPGHDFAAVVGVVAFPADPPLVGWMTS